MGISRVQKKQTTPSSELCLRPAGTTRHFSINARVSEEVGQRSHNCPVHSNRGWGRRPYFRQGVHVIIYTTVQNTLERETLQDLYLRVSAEKINAVCIYYT